MVACVYIKGDNIHFYNEGSSLSEIGGLSYRLGVPMLNFVCYDPERFDEGFSVIAEAFDNEFAHIGAEEPEFISALRQSITELQQDSVYLFFYGQMFMDFILAFIESPQKAIKQLADVLPGAEDKLLWAMKFRWSGSQPYPDMEKRLFRAAKDVVVLMSEHLRAYQGAVTNEINLLLSFREAMGAPESSPMEYLYYLEQYRMKNTGSYYYLERPFHSLYGVLPSQEIVELYEVNTIDDLFRFEFIKMIEHDIFIKKCKNCERFFIPKRRVDAEYCERVYGDSQRKCSEIGAMLRYERKVAENPILEAYSKAYKRFNSRTRAKKMTQTEFLNWSEQARKLRDECVAGAVPFEEFTAWLEQGRVRKPRGEQCKSQVMS